MAFLYAVRQGQNARNRRPNAFRNHIDELSDRECVDRFRLDKHSIEELSNLITPFLVLSVYNNRAVPAVIQLCITLRYLATGDMQRSVGDVFNVSQAAVSNIVRSVTTAIARISQNYIFMPRGDESRRIMGSIFHKYQLPKVIGLIDGTHIRIQSPRENEYSYVNRKNYHSINVQVITDGHYNIRDVVAR